VERTNRRQQAARISPQQPSPYPAGYRTERTEAKPKSQVGVGERAFNLPFIFLLGFGLLSNVGQSQGDPENRFSGALSF